MEARSGYGLLHGEAVAIGMAAEAWLAEELGIASRRTRGGRCSISSPHSTCPAACPTRSRADQLLETMLHDKKVRAGALRFALPAAIGRMAQSADGAWTVDVAREQIVRAIEANR